MIARISRNTWKRLLTTILAVYWIALLIGTHWPLPLMPVGNPIISNDKVLHFSAYTGLALLLMAVVRLRQPSSQDSPSFSLRQFLVVVAIVSGAGLLDEVTQPLVKRDFDWFDWLADTAGACAGAVLALAFELHLTMQQPE